MNKCLPTFVEVGKQKTQKKSMAITVNAIFDHKDKKIMFHHLYYYGETL